MKSILLVIFLLCSTSLLFAQAEMDARKARLNSVTSNETIETFDLAERVTVRLTAFFWRRHC